MAVVQLTPKEQLMDYLYLKNDEFDLCDFDIYNINDEQYYKIMQLFEKDEFDKNYFDNQHLYIFYVMYIITKTNYDNKLQCQILFDVLNYGITAHNCKLCYYFMNDNMYAFEICDINYDKNINYLNKSIELKCISAIQHKINDILAEADNLDPINSNNNIDSMNTVITCLNDVDKIVPLPCTLNHINYINEIKQLFKLGVDAGFPHYCEIIHEINNMNPK